MKIHDLRVLIFQIFDKMVCVALATWIPDIGSNLYITPVHCDIFQQFLKLKHGRSPSRLNKIYNSVLIVELYVEDFSMETHILCYIVLLRTIVHNHKFIIVEKCCIVS